MKYTRYDYNKKKSGNFILSLIIVIILAIIIGATIFKLFPKNVEEFIDNNDTMQTSGEINNKQSINNYVAIQCGVYQNIDNANMTLATIPSDFKSFIIEEEGKYKVIAGIYSESEVSDKINALNSVKINNFSIKFNIDTKNNNALIISEIIKSYLEIINKVSQDDVDSISTNEFKDWVKIVTKNSDDEHIHEIINITNNLPEEIKKENNVELMKNLYNILSKMKK